MKARYTHQISVPFKPTDIRRLDAASEVLECSRADVVRQCVMNDLPKLLDRTKKRMRRRKKNDRADNF